MAENEMTFEQKLQSVQEMITGIESGKLPLEDAVKQYEEGMKLLNQLDADLEDMNRRITVLQKGTDGQEEDPPGGAE